MATLQFYAIPPSGDNTQVIGAGSQIVPATTAGTPITIGHNVLVRLVASAAMNIRFGKTGVTSAGATDIYLAPNVPEIWDMGRYNEVIVPWGGAAGATLYWNIVSKA